MYIFISYSGDEGLRYAKILKEVLSHGGHETFLFEQDNTIDSELYYQIGNALDKCRIAAIIITESSHTSEEQKIEYGTALSMKSGQGIIKEGVRWGGFSLLRAKQYIKFNDSNAADKMEDFLKKINRIPENAQTLTTNDGEEIR